VPQRLPHEVYNATLWVKKVWVMKKFDLAHKFSQNWNF